MTLKDFVCSLAFAAFLAAVFIICLDGSLTQMGY